MSRFASFAVDRPGRLALPIGLYAGLEFAGATVRDAVCGPAVQVAAIQALHARLETPVLMTAMDLSLEAEAFGCEVRMSAAEVPAVVGRRASDAAGIAALPDPRPGDARTGVPLEAVRRLAAAAAGAPILGCMIGPFSLAARIFGFAEALEATSAEPPTVLALLEKATAFLVRQAQAFRAAGADGVVVAEPAAGLLSPAALARFSAPFAGRIVAGAQGPDFAIVLHNCAAKLVHLTAARAAGAEILHFGSPMDLPAALRRVAGEAILAGNLDPTAVFLHGTPATVRQRTQELLAATADQRNLIVSSGCDIPPGTPLANLEAFVAAVREHAGRA
ncbi:MAG: uroporphyrinogen decarboxylase family protein [Planctomycetota bacterium]